MFTMVGGKPVYERGSKWDVRRNKWEMLINPAEARERGHADSQKAEGLTNGSKAYGQAEGRKG